MIRFVLIGEEYSASKIASILINNDDVELVAVFTDLSKDGALAKIAEKNNIELRDSLSLREEETVHWLRSLKGMWLINILSAVIIPEDVLKLFPGRALNLHTGPLPEYAGIHVHQWGIRNGETEFAVTIHHMEIGVDTGAIVAEQRFEISHTDTGLSLFNKVMREGARLFEKVLISVIAGHDLPAHPQDMSRRKYYRNSDAVNGCINWKWSSRKIVDFVRAGNYHPFLSPSYTATLDDSKDSPLILSAQEAEASDEPAGQVIELTNMGPRIACGMNESVILDKAIDESGPLNIEDWEKYMDGKEEKQFLSDDYDK